MSVASALQNAQQKVAAAYTACNSKGATMPAAGSQNLSNLPATINSISTGGGGDTYPTEDAPYNDVQFIGHDGLIIASMSAEDFLALDDYPTFPCPSGLVHDGWNWPFATAKAYVTKYRKLDVGRLYNTTDGKTRIHIRLGGEPLTRSLRISQLVSGGTVIINWGDGTEETVSGSGNKTASHTYASSKDYIITLNVTSGAIRLGHSTGTNAGIDCRSGEVIDVNIGSGVTIIGRYAFGSKNALRSVSFPSTVTGVELAAFYECHAIRSIIIPNGVTSLANVVNSGTTVTLTARHIVLPPSITSLTNNTFRRFFINERIIFPEGMTATSSAFYQNNSFREVVIPDTITTITAQAFGNAYGCLNMYCYPTAPPTIANANAFTNLNANCVIHVPADSLEAYQGATNWSARADHMVGDL